MRLMLPENELTSFLRLSKLVEDREGTGNEEFRAG